MWRALGALLLAATLGGCGFAGVNPRSAGSAPGQLGYQVGAGDSIYSIAARNGVTVEAIAARNSLAPPYQLTVGQRLALPAPSSYVVQPGELMDQIARRFGITPSELARVNGIAAPYPVQPGQTLSIPQGLSSGGVVATAAPAGSVQVSALPPPGSVGLATTGTALPPASVTGLPGSATGAPVPLVGPQDPLAATTQPQVYTLLPPDLNAGSVASAAPPLPPAPADIAQPLPAVIPPAADTIVATPPSAPASSNSGGGLPSLSGSGFLQPVTGQVLTRFGEGSPVPNDGVNIAAPTGTAIYAAESGVVAYVGEDIDTFGNLVLIRHADGWVTAYGHAEAIVVGEGEVVTRGQVIGRVGTSGGVTVPQLHFELRRGTEPVDPMAYLES